MINVEKIVCGLLKENCYILYDSNKNALIIDPGGHFDTIHNFILQNWLNVCGILLTHGHFDHIGAVKPLQDLGYKVYIHQLDSDKCSNLELSLAKQFSRIETFVPDYTFECDKQVLNIGGFEVTVLHTPGHSKGSCCFCIDKYLFSGDTLFHNGYGRTDFYDGNSGQLFESLNLLKNYAHLQLMPGH
ncbi:MAG: MBL fold metallo-hydrolase [Clostridiales bacterium]|nr:MBL fold metallo-hydrolase [Clostridiales bacterium]